ncbi:MAG: hypothetical protein SF052_03805, partial [Bacteroidia bacterium]|nr:hypothetical protein [Bacteroidia bacterium]
MRFFRFFYEFNKGKYFSDVLVGFDEMIGNKQVRKFRFSLYGHEEGWLRQKTHPGFAIFARTVGLVIKPLDLPDVQYTKSLRQGIQGTRRAAELRGIEHE